VGKVLHRHEEVAIVGAGERNVGEDNTPRDEVVDGGVVVHGEGYILEDDGLPGGPRTVDGDGVGEGVRAGGGDESEVLDADDGALLGDVEGGVGGYGDISDADACAVEGEGLGQYDAMQAPRCAPARDIDSIPGSRVRYARLHASRVGRGCPRRAAPSTGGAGGGCNQQKE